MNEVKPTLVPLPIGTKVNYHGSYKTLHGEYIIWGVIDSEALRHLRRGHFEEYIDGVGYEIWPSNVLHKWGNREQAIHYVRRGSITPVYDMIEQENTE
jgi:hypothetical protein